MELCSMDESPIGHETSRAQEVTLLARLARKKLVRWAAHAKQMNEKAGGERQPAGCGRNSGSYTCVRRGRCFSEVALATSTLLTASSAAGSCELFRSCEEETRPSAFSHGSY